MSIKFACPICKAPLSAPDGMVGAKAPCGKCGQRVEVPGAGTNKTLLGHLIPEKGAFTKLGEAISAGPDYDPNRFFTAEYGGTATAGLSTPEVRALLQRNWDLMSGEEFEKFLVEVFRCLGYPAEKTIPPDQGVDLIVTVGTKRIAVQAKRWGKNVGNDAIQEVHLGVKHWCCDFCIAITNRKFTRSAEDAARAAKCGLVDGAKLPDLIRGRFIPPAAAVLRGTPSQAPVLNPIQVPQLTLPSNPAFASALPSPAQVSPSFPPPQPSPTQPASGPTHCFKCGGKLHNALGCDDCLECFCSENCLNTHQKNTGHSQQQDATPATSSDLAAAEPANLRSDFGTDPDKWGFDSSSETGKMHTACCPNCGSKRNYRHQSCGTVQPCTTCGGRFELPYPPRPRPERNDGMALAIGVVVVAVFFMCSLPFWAFHRSSPDQTRNRQDFPGEKAQVPRKDPPDHVGPGKAEMAAEQARAAEAKRRAEEAGRRLAEAKRRAEEEANAKVQREAMRKQPLSELRQTLKGNDQKNRAIAAEVLGQRGASAAEAVPDLIAALQDQDKIVIEQAALALGMIGPPAKSALPVLIQAVGNSDQVIAQAAQQAVARIGPLTKDDIPTLTASLKDMNRAVRLFAVATISQMGPEAMSLTPSLVTLIAEPDEALRAESLNALEKIGPGAKEAIPSLVAALKDKDWAYRLRAAEVLAAIGTFRAAPAAGTLADFLKDKDTKTRLRAIAALGKLGPDAWSAVRPLVQSLKDTNSEIRSATTEALGKIGKDAVPAMVQSLQSDINSNVRLGCCVALGEIGPDAKDAVPALRAVSSEDRNKEVQNAAAHAIDKIQRKK